ncbi:MAG: 2OG-Fe(II) oxygenase [Streptosporangiaceae bacterium]
MSAARERLARLLDGKDSARPFSAQFLAPAGSLRVEIEGVGQLKLPVTPAQARKLIQRARPASFGRGEETLTDVSVRDTWEITPDLVTITTTGWPALLDNIRDDLGLPPRTRLSAELHSMLVYGKGQFFLPHQDSEKDDDMVATLVLTLPSKHTGGELVIHHNGESDIHRAHPSDLSFAAFYADCRHEITPVKSGYRVALTFNLLAQQEPTEGGPDQEVSDLARCLNEHFATKVPRHYGTDLELPHRLVYLLDHEYTVRGLSWKRLKGADAERARMLRAAAEEAGCDAVLALAEVKETWSAYGAEDDFGYDYDDEYDEDEEELDSEDYEVTELIEDEVALGWWTSPSAKGGEPISLFVPAIEVCASTPSAALVPYNSEYEGYMGNYGNTLERWYRRAAVVVWPHERAFVARAEASTSWALAELSTRIGAGDLDGARAAAESVAPFWKTSMPVNEGMLETALRVATDLAQPATAAMLLEPFGITTLTPADADAFTALVERYGEQWTRTLVAGWFGPMRRWIYSADPDLQGWIESLPRFRDALRDFGEPGATATRVLLSASWNYLNDQFQHLAHVPSVLRKERLEYLGTPLARLLEAGGGDAAAIVPALRERGNIVLEWLLPTLRASTKLSGPARSAAGLDVLARDCAERLGVILAQHIREEDDWSITWPGGCSCELCGTLRAFLTASDRRRLDWPLAKEKRRHIHDRIDGAELPMLHETTRKGRPYTLVVTKTEELFTRELATRQQAVTDLAWLAENWDVE